MQWSVAKAVERRKKMSLNLLSNHQVPGIEPRISVFGNEFFPPVIRLSYPSFFVFRALWQLAQIFFSCFRCSESLHLSWVARLGAAKDS